MEALNSLLQELAAREQRLVKQWKAVLKRRDIEDLDYQLRKDAENAVWQQRFLDRDSEEDVSRTFLSISASVDIESNAGDTSEEARAYPWTTNNPSKSPWGSRHWRSANTSCDHARSGGPITSSSS